jgi:hypothetical protein
MAWVHFPMAAGDQVQPGPFKELSEAYAERFQALGGAAPTIGGNAGDNIQQAVGGSYASYADWQTWVEANCGSFIRTDVTYDGGGAPTSPADWPYDLASFRTAAGLNASGFTRRYWRSFSGLAATVYDDGSAFANGHKALNAADNLVYSRAAGAWVYVGGPWGGTAPDTVTTFGIMQAGDIIDHVTLNELYRAFHALRWQLITIGHDIFTITSNEGDNNPGRGGAPAYTWATAKPDAEASWDTGTPAPSVGVRDATSPTAYSLGWYNGTLIEAELQGQRLRYVLDLSTVWAGLSRTAELYAYATVPPLHQTAGAGDSVFDANGFTLSQDDWRKFDSFGPTASTGTHNSPYLGKSAATDYPVWCDEPLPATTATTEKGFYVRNAAGIIKWDVAGGFAKP